MFNDLKGYNETQHDTIQFSQWNVLFVPLNIDDSAEQGTYCVSVCVNGRARVANKSLYIGTSSI